MKKADKKLFTRLAEASARRQVLLGLMSDHEKKDVTVFSRYHNSAYMDQAVDKCFHPAHKVVLRNWTMQNKHEKADFKELCRRSTEAIENANMDMRVALHRLEYM